MAGRGRTLDHASGSARCRFSERRHGDLGVQVIADELGRRRAALVDPDVHGVDSRWVDLAQVHGDRVVHADDAIGAADRPEADALVTDRVGVVLSVNVADCAPVALLSRQGVVGAVHAGWRGLDAGVIGAAVAAMRALGARDIDAWLGPCIHPECYEFGGDELDRLTVRFGPAVRSRTRRGRLAFDVPMAVARELGTSGVRLVGSADTCTACDPERFYSFRARQDEGRHALAVWIERDDR